MESERPLKVCILAPHFPPDFGWYGTGRDAMELAYALFEKGHQPEIIACSETLGAAQTHQDGFKVRRIKWLSEGRPNSISSHSLPRARVLMNLNLAAWRAFLAAYKETQFDIVDVSNYSAESLLPSIIAECPVVARQYDMNPEFLDKELSLIGDSGFKFEQQISATLKSVAGRCAFAVATVGKDESPAAAEKQSVRLNYSIDAEDFSPDGLPALDTGERPTLLIHTAIQDSRYLNLISDVVLRIKKEIPDLWLTIVAHDTYSESSESELKDELVKSNVTCDMVINHKMSRLLMPGLWRSSWCGLVLGWQRLSPYAILEPLSCAVPIIAETEKDLPGFLREADLLLNPKEFNADAIAEKLIATLKNAEIRKTAGAKCRQYILKEHCRNSNADKTLQAYQQSIENYKSVGRSRKTDTAERVLELMKDLSSGLDQWLYDLLFIRSFRFKLSHWLRKFRQSETSIK